MLELSTITNSPLAARKAGRPISLLTAGALALFASAPARADFGCTVLLCLAAPSWRAIAQCVPPVTLLLRDLAQGHAFPSCRMGGPGNESGHRFSFAPGYCPPQYIRERPGPSGPRYYCLYTGAISVTVNGALFTRTWWHPEGDSVTEFLPPAKAQLGTWDPRFDDEYALWLGEQPVAPITTSD
jgi:hypothetical protein